MSRAALGRSLAGVFCISFSGIWVRTSDLPAFSSAFYRCALALVFLLLLSVVLGEVPALKSALGSFGLLIAGGFLGADLLAWHGSILRLGAGLATVLPNLQVVFVGLAAIWIFGERPRALFWCSLPILLFGVGMLATQGEAVVESASLLEGVLLGVLTAILYSGYLILLRRARLAQPELRTLASVTAITFGASVVTLFGLIIEGRWELSLPPTALYSMLGLSIGSHAIGWLLLASSIHRVPSSLSSLFLVLQPALALVWGSTLLGEKVQLTQIVGAGLILLGVSLGTAAVPAKRSTRGGGSSAREGGSDPILEAGTEV